MHMLRHYESLKTCKECICIFAYIYMSFHDKVKDLNGFINVLLMVTLTPYDCYD